MISVSSAVGLLRGLSVASVFLAALAILSGFFLLRAATTGRHTKPGSAGPIRSTPVQRNSTRRAPTPSARGSVQTPSNERTETESEQDPRRAEADRAEEDRASRYDELPRTEHQDSSAGLDRRLGDDGHAVPVVGRELIPAAGEPLASRQPMSQRARNEIRKIARMYPNWGLREIREEARRRGLDVDEVTVKDLLRHDKRPGRNW